jgi:hypothetical protein
MTTRSLLDAVIDPGIRNPNYFEGRLLTADALRDDQRAQRERQRLLGRAIGAGVVEGLTVEVQAVPAGTVRRTVTIAKGYAINAEGDTLWLQDDLVADVVPPIAVPEAPATLFARCRNGATPEPTVPVGVGLYVLVIYPASAYRERAAKSGLGSEGRIIGCGDRFAVDGVRFRLERLDPSNISGASTELQAELATLLSQTGDVAKRSLLRNLAAHLCFGTPELAQFAVDPFARRDGMSALLRHGAVDDLRDLRPRRISGCDVPLALILWDTTGIAFVDMWAVRRRPVPPPRSSEWPLLAGEGAAVEGEARLLQFQAHATDLAQELADPTAGEARACFRYLPAAGILPMVGGPAQPGFAYPRFFTGVPHRNNGPRAGEISPFVTGVPFVEGAATRSMLRAALDYPPIDLAGHAIGNEFIWLFQVRENRQAINGSASPPQPCLLFASGQLPEHGLARFDQSRWGYSNLA